LVLVVILVLFGAKRIPEFAKGIGKGITEFKKASREVTDEIERAVDEPPPAPPPKTPHPIPTLKTPLNLPPCQDLIEFKRQVFSWPIPLKSRVQTRSRRTAAGR